MHINPTIAKAFHDMLTENDGKSYCVVRIIGMIFSTLVVLFFFGGWLYRIWTTKQFEAMAFAESAGVAVTVISASLSGSITLKAFSDNFGQRRDGDHDHDGDKPQGNQM
jgi:hypothetical protein